MVKLLVVIITIMNDVIRRGREGVLPLVGCWFNFQIVNSLLINLHILLRYPTPKFYFLMGPHAMPVRIKTWGQDDIMFKSTKIFHLFDKISGNSGRHFLQPSQPIDFQSILIYGIIVIIKIPTAFRFHYSMSIILKHLFQLFGQPNR